MNNLPEDTLIHETRMITFGYWITAQWKYSCVWRGMVIFIKLAFLIKKKTM